jgi:hypothetical protein
MTETAQLVEAGSPPIFDCEIPYAVTESIASWRRIIGASNATTSRKNVEHAAVELWRVVDINATAHPETSDVVRQVVVDALYEFGVTAGLGDDESQAILAKARNAPADAGQVVPLLGDKIASTALETLTPIAWKGTEPIKQRWLAHMRIPSGDLTIGAGNGGAGKTEIFMQLVIAVAAMLGDWLGCVVECGTALFLSCEEPDHERIEAIAQRLRRKLRANQTNTLVKFAATAS